MTAVMRPDFEGREASLLFLELARYLRAAAASKTVEVVPSSLISMIMAPEVIII